MYGEKKYGYPFGRKEEYYELWLAEKVEIKRTGRRTKTISAPVRVSNISEILGEVRLAMKKGLGCHD
jgi:hypothetical protein